MTPRVMAADRIVYASVCAGCCAVVDNTRRYTETFSVCRCPNVCVAQQLHGEEWNSGDVYHGIANVHSRGNYGIGQTSQYRRAITSHPTNEMSRTGATRHLAKRSTCTALQSTHLPNDAHQSTLEHPGDYYRHLRSSYGHGPRHIIGPTEQQTTRNQLCGQAFRSIFW